MFTALLCRISDGLEVLLPHEFAANTVAVNPARALTAVAAIACRSGINGPRLAVPDILDRLAERYSMHRAVELIRQMP